MLKRIRLKLERRNCELEDKRCSFMRMGFVSPYPVGLMTMIFFFADKPPAKPPASEAPMISSASRKAMKKVVLLKPQTRSSGLASIGVAYR